MAALRPFSHFDAVLVAVGWRAETGGLRGCEEASLGAAALVQGELMALGSSVSDTGGDGGKVAAPGQGLDVDGEEEGSRTNLKSGDVRGW